MVSLREHFASTYGTLAMVHAAISDGRSRYAPVHYAIRARFRNNYLAGKMKMRPLHDDDKTKIQYPTTCCYCGIEKKLTLDHVIPQIKGGPHSADNITWACRSCNSSKGAKDMVMWLVSKGRFPAVRVFRRYLKLTSWWCEHNDVMDLPWGIVPNSTLPFDKRSLRVKWPKLSEQCLWPSPDPS